jgi:hypothetical protein
MLTFFEPLIATNPPVMGRTRWSVLDVVLKVRDGKLPVVVNSFLFLDLSILITLIYLFLLLALVAVCLLPIQRLLGVISAVGGAIVYTAWQWGRMPLEMMFYGHWGVGDWPAKFGPLMLTLLAVMLVLVFIATHEALDE